MNQSQTLLFPSATHVYLPFKSGFVVSRLPPPSASRNGAPSFPFFFPLSFFFVKSGLLPGEAQRVPHIHLTCHFSHSSLDHCLPFPPGTAL